MLMEEGVPEVQPLTDAQKDVINATAPVLAERGFTITKRFYQQMLRAHPELRDVFSESSQKTDHQAFVLSQAVHAYAENIHDLTPLLPVVQRIAYKHASLHITPEQYAIVGRHLIQAIVDVLGEAVTPEIGDAWTHGYWNLAKIFIDTERGMYAEATKNGGWVGWKEFTIAKKVKESDEVVSLYLEPKEPRQLLPYHPGQYIAVSLYIPSLGYKQARQYSLSDVPNERLFRISVRREDHDKAHPGRVSNALHAIQEGTSIGVAYPGGDFHLDSSDNGKSPLVLLSAGIGQTPLYSILRSQVENGRPITYATVARNHSTQAFDDDLRRLADEHSNVTYRTFHSRPDANNAGRPAPHFEGRLSTTKLEQELHLSNKGAGYYLCGPSQFMLDIKKQLSDLGVEEKRIHLELFSAGDPQ